ncbi:hypothetical protein K469DRAFT_599987, partial [Zopfia rhizophila CBS 207.26]
SVNEIKKMCWPAYSPDVNACEHPWPWIRRHITKNDYVSHDEEQCRIQWARVWHVIPQKQMDKWIDRIPDVIRQIIKYKGDNCFHDG